MWRRLASYGPSVLSDMAVIAVIIAAVSIAAVALQLALQRRARTALIGPPQAALRFRLGRARPWLEAGLWSYLALVVAMPVASLVATSLTPTYGVPLTAATLTFASFEEVLATQAVTARAFMNSTLAAGIAGLVLAAMAVVLGFFLAHRLRALRLPATLAASLADIAYAVPGLVVSIAFILAFIRPLPVIDTSLYGSLTVIFLAYLAAFFSIALKPVGAAYAQLDGSLDDAARVAGAGFRLRLTRIFLPLVAPAAASGALLVFLTAYNEVTVSALLWSSGNETIGSTIFNYEDGGYTTLASAMSVVTIVATVALMLTLNLLGRRLPAGVVPWRD
jgi:iron(III) transport system permease protein